MTRSLLKLQCETRQTISEWRPCSPHVISEHSVSIQNSSVVWYVTINVPHQSVGISCESDPCLSQHSVLNVLQQASVWCPQSTSALDLKQRWRLIWIKAYFISVLLCFCVGVVCHTQNLSRSHPDTDKRRRTSSKLKPGRLPGHEGEKTERQRAGKTRRDRKEEENMKNRGVEGKVKMRGERGKEREDGHTSPEERWRTVITKR